MPGNKKRKLKADNTHFEIRTLPELTLLSISKRGYYSGCFFKAAQDGYTELYDYLDTHGLSREVVHRISIFPELPYSMNDPDAVIHCGFSITKEIRPERPFELLTIQEGNYAVFPYSGPYEYMYQMWIIAYYKCFLIGNEQVRDVAPFELYLNSPRDTPLVTSGLKYTSLSCDRKTGTAISAAPNCSRADSHSSCFMWPRP